MNSTKKITNAAILLAIIGALLMLDRLLGYLFYFYILLASSIVLIVYINKYSMKDGIYLALGILFFIFLFGYIDTYIYGPCAILFSFIYCYFENKGYSIKQLSYVSVISYGLLELITTVAILPLFGVTIDSEIEEVSEMAAAIGSAAGISINYPTSILITIIVLSTLLTGVLEGYLINLLSVYFLRRFKIKVIPNTNNSFNKPNTIVSYVCMILFIVSYIVNQYFDNTIVTSILISICAICGFILVYYGFLFLVAYSRKKNMRYLPMLLLISCFILPYLLIVLMIVGFLYGSGPLYNYIRSLNEEQK